MADTYCLSYGELSIIDEEWNKYKLRYGIHDADGEDIWRFIESKFKGIYETDEEQTSVFNEVSIIETTRAENEAMNGFLREVYCTMRNNHIKTYEVSGKWLRVTNVDGDIEEIEMS